MAAALSEDLKVEQKEEKEEEVVAQAPVDPHKVAEDSDGIGEFYSIAKINNLIKINCKI